IVALERGGIAMTCPVRLEDDLQDLAVVGPTGGDPLSAARASAVQQHHVAVFGAHLVEGGPDTPVVVALGATCEGDACAGGSRSFGLGATPCGDEFAAIYQSGRERAVVDDGTRTRAPGRAGLDCEQLSGMIAKELEDVAPLDQRQALVDQRLQLAG